jgi:hypothetical protein
MLYGLAGNDWFSLTAATRLLLLAGLASGFLPARRASGIDPVVALRDEENGGGFWLLPRIPRVSRAAIQGGEY